MGGPYGMTPTGFVQKSAAAIQADIARRQKATISPSLDTDSADSTMAKANATFVGELAEGWDQLRRIFEGWDPNAADMLLTILCKITGTVRRAATPSKVTLTCDLDEGTVLAAGVTFASVASKPDVRFTPVADYEALTSGPQPVDFQSELLGPINGFAGTITVIATPTTGWNSVTNALDAVPGRVVDDDPTLRLRRRQELATAGTATVRAVKANLLQQFPQQIISLDIFENDTDYTDPVTGNPPHSLEVVVYHDGSITDDVFGQAIYDARAGAINLVGNTSATVVTDETPGATKTIGFSRVTQVPIFLSFQIKAGTNYVGDAAFKDFVAEEASAEQLPGADVVAPFMKAIVGAKDARAFLGITDIALFQLGTTPAPSGTSDIPIDIRQIAVFDSSRITVTEV